MKVAKVIGTIWSTRKDDRLSGHKLLIVRPLDVINGAADQAPIVAADVIGAGVGETVIIVSGSSARHAAGGQDVPVDASVVGIVDNFEVESEQV